MRLTGDSSGDGPPRDRGQSVAVLRRAVELGVNHIDTAAFYFSPLRSANELIAAALAPYPDDVVIATKVGPWRDAGGAWQGMAAPDQLRGQVEENLRHLGRDHLDLVNLRTLSVSKPVGEHFAALAALRDTGLIRHLGLSNVTVEQIDEALAIAPVVAVQNRYSIDSRRPEADDVLGACAQRGIAFVPFFAIAGEGREGGRRAGELEPVLAVARAHGAMPAQGRLAWTLAQEPRPGDPRNQQPGAPGRERGRRRAAPHGRGTGSPRLPGLSVPSIPSASPADPRIISAPSAECPA